MRCHGQVVDQVMGQLMEGTMLSTRIGIAGACFLLCTAVAAASAAAQTDAAGAVGKPLALLQFIHKNGKAKPRPHSKTAAESATRVGNAKSVRRTVAEPPSAPLRGDQTLENATVQARQAPEPEVPAAAAAKNDWPAADPAAPGQMSALTPQPAPTPQSAPAPVTNEAVAQSPHNETVAGAPSAATTAQPSANAAQFAPAGAPPPAPMKAAQAAAPENQTLAETARAAPVRAMVAAPSYEDTGPVGSASWIAHVVAALGGAFAAGAIAWFLIRPASRTFG